MIPERLQKIVANFGEKDRGMVVSAYEEAVKALKGKMRSNNHPFIEHPLNTAYIISDELGLGADSITALLLHEANRFSGNTPAEVNSGALLEKFRGIYPQSIIGIVTSLNNISFITLQQTNLDEERYRKLIISYSTDPRVVLIKIADRLEIMRNLSILPPSKRKAKVMETILLYIPLAHQLGLYHIKSELEDIFLKYSDPEQYRLINNYLKATEKDREELVTRFIGPLEEKMKAEGIAYTLKGRTKSAYSIWKKMQVQKVPIEKVYDIFAIRFILDCPPERQKEHELCWKVYSLVTEEYTPDTSRLRDWLTRPKPSGYESLHTTVSYREGTNIEVQIRTVRMDFDAEQGQASHWAYKGVKSEESLTSWLNRVRTIMQSGSSERYKQLSPMVLNEIFVFTPTGDLRQLPEGATVLDFAFDIHSNLGLKCTGGRINGRMVPIKEKLKTGDVVEIISGKNQKPTRDWLTFVVTSKARSKIRLKLKEEENKKATAGKELLDRRLKNWKLELNDADLHALVVKYRYKSINEFYAALGDDALDVMKIKDYLTDESRNKPVVDSTPHQEKTQSRSQDSDYLVIDNKLSNVDYKMAKCCNPIFGDEVFGFVTIKEGIKIHRISCPNASRLISNYPYRIQKVKWKESAGKASSQVSLKVIVDDDMAASNKVISTVNMFKTSIRSFNIVSRPKGEHEIDMVIFVPNNLELDKILASIRKIKEVKQVTRL